MAVRFTTKSCVEKYNELLFTLLKKILNNLISDLSCHIKQPSYKCHSVKIPKRGLIPELFIAFQGKKNFKLFFNFMSLILNHDKLQN